MSDGRLEQRWLDADGHAYTWRGWRGSLWTSEGDEVALGTVRMIGGALCYAAEVSRRHWWSLPVVTWVLALPDASNVSIEAAIARIKNQVFP